MDRKVLETGNFRFSNGYFPLDSDATKIITDMYFYVTDIPSHSTRNKSAQSNKKMVSGLERSQNYKFVFVLHILFVPETSFVH